MWLRRALPVGLLAAIGVTGFCASASAAVLVSTSGTVIDGSRPTQNGRIATNAQASSCAPVLDLAPTVTQTGTQFHYANHTFRSRLTNPICIEASLATSCAGSNSIFSVAYIGEFNPADPLDRYAADMGGLAPGSYGFNPPAGAFFSIVVHETTANAGCSGYNLTVTSKGPWANSSPAIVGNAAAVGNAITGNNATWETGAAAQPVERQWRRCDTSGANCADIAGANASTYTVTNDDLGHTLRFRNTVTDADGTSSSESAYVEPFIPFETRSAGSLGSGDRVHSGVFIRDAVESRCSTPKAAPTILQPGSNFLFDSFAVQSLLNEPVCLVVRTLPGAGCGSGVSPTIYSPAFAPAAGIQQNYAANSGNPFNSVGLASTTLPAAEGREVVVSIGNSLSACDQYSVVAGADAPFASARPAVSGNPMEGATLATTDGTWSGTPGFSHSWLRCDASGAACTPIGGAAGATYTPVAGDVGSRLRSRVTATQGRSVSSDSEATAVVAVQPRDLTAPKGTVRLGSRNLAKAAGSGRVPVTVTCDEACSAVVQVRVTRKLARAFGMRRKIVIATAKGRATAGRRTTLRAKLARKARRALRGRKVLKVSLAATFTDTAGNRSKRSAKGTLKRPRRR